MDLSITRPDIVVPVHIDPTGRTGPTPGQARGKRWRTTSPGRVTPADPSPVSTDQRIVEAACGLPDGTAVTGWAALHWEQPRWSGGRASDGTERPVPLAISDTRSIARRPGVQVVFDWLFDDDIVWVDGLPITRVERSVTFEARRARSDEQAIQIICMAAATDRIDLTGLAAYVARLPCRKGVRRLRRALARADENAWSPMEVTMRERWRAQGHPVPLFNVPIFDLDGHHLLTPDLFDPVNGVIGEYDGAVHLGAPVRRRDLNREETCREHGLEMVTMMSTDLRDLTSFARRLDTAYERATARTLEPSWTLDQPHWWVDTSTVARRRALSPADRERWLRRLD